MGQSPIMRDTPWNHALQDAVDDGTVPGAVTLVARGDEVHLESVGVMALGADDWLAALATLPLAHQPGEGFRYHHSFSVLGILLQRLAGVPLQDHLEQVVLGPLGMVDTGLTVPEEKAHRLPAAYRHGQGGLEDVEPLGGGFYVGPAPFDTAHFTVVSEESEDGSVIGYRSVDEAGLRAVLEVLLRPGAGPLAAGQDG